jgi:5-methylcytosine-specific restriction protein A
VDDAVAKLTSLRPRLGSLRPRLASAPLDRQAYDRQRDERPWRKWYKTARWQKLRMQVLTRDLFTCQRCKRIEADTSQLVADHRRPHRGVEALFWDIVNLWTLCKPCHDSWKQREERRGHG